MKFAKLLLLVAFSFLSIGINIVTVRAEGSGYGYNSECKAPMSLPNGEVGCGDEQPSPSSDCAYTANGSSVCAGEPEIVYDSQPTPPPASDHGFSYHLIEVGKEAIPATIGGAVGGGISGGPVGAAAGAAGGAVGGTIQSCLKCH